MDSSSPWSVADVPDQSGRTVVITGANTGIGYETAKVLARRGAAVVLACRDVARAEAAAARIGTGTVTVLRLDLASLASVREAAACVAQRYPRLDLLINNAGVMMVPRGRTADGFETHLGVNHLGHFALTGLLLDRLRDVPGARVVTVSSNGHRQGAVDFDDLGSERSYRPLAAYCRSKLANLLFAHELHDRLTSAGVGTESVAAHPGAARTELGRTSPFVVRAVMSGRTRRLFSGWLMQDAAAGALPVLRAATDPGVRGGEYLGPSGWKEFTGAPVRVRAADRAHDLDARRRLWSVSESLTGVRYRFEARHPA